MEAHDAGSTSSIGSTDLAESAAVPIDFAFYVDEWGLRMGISRIFGERRDFMESQLALPGGMTPASYWSERFDDVHPSPDPFPVRAGEPLSVEAWVDPDCDDAQALPVFVLKSRDALGQVRVDSYKPTDPKAYRAALAEWCAMPPSVSVSASKQWPDGRFEVTLQVFNPTSEPVTAKSAGMTIAGTVWESASTEVAPRSRGELTLRGHGDGCSSENPWGTGHVTIDGVVQELEEWESEQC
jgi:hypothetical protein